MDLNEKQIFVRNLSFQTTTEDLTSLFENIGPLKNVSIAISEDGKSKGFGFVKFALESDAADAVKSLQGKSLQGRKMKLEIAKKPAGKKGSSGAASTATTTAAVTAHGAAGDADDDSAAPNPTETVVEEKREENEPTNAVDGVNPMSVPSATVVVRPTKLKEIAKAKARASKKAAAKSKKASGAGSSKASSAAAEDSASDDDDEDDGSAEEGTHGEGKSLATSVKRTRQLVVFGVPTDINKKALLHVLGKKTKKLTMELVKQDHELSESLRIIHPAGKIMLVTANSRKLAAAVLPILDASSVRSLGLRPMITTTMTTAAAITEIGTAETASAESVVPTRGPSPAANNNAAGKKEKLVVRYLADLTPVDLLKRKCRLIIRNLSFQATEQNVLDKMSKFGPLVSVEIPRVAIEHKKTMVDGKPKPPRKRKRMNAGADGDHEGDGAAAGGGDMSIGSGGGGVTNVSSAAELKPRGFGFVTFLCEKDAAKAVQESGSLGLKICNREVAVDFCMSKESYSKYGTPTAAATDTDSAADSAGALDGGAEGKVGEEGDESYVVHAREGSLKKQKPEDAEGVDGASTTGEDSEEEEEQGSESGGDSDGESDDDGGDSDEEEEEQEEDDDEENGSVDRDADSNSEGQRSDDEGKGDSKKTGTPSSFLSSEKKQPAEFNDVKEGCTIFVRDLAFDVEPSDLKAAFGVFGRIALAITVKDKQTGLPKGTAFVKYVNPASAAACLETARRQVESTRSTQPQQQQQRARKERGNNDESAAHKSGEITVKNRPCRVDLAVDKNAAESFKAGDRVGRDKRNLYLANEGLIITSNADDHDDEERGGGGEKKAGGAGVVSVADREKRMRAQTEKKKKLQNPLFFVSATRLSIRNLSKNVTDQELKKTCITATKAALKRNLVSKSDLENLMRAQGGAACVGGVGAVGGEISLSIPPIDKKSVRTAKVMLDMDRVRGGAAQSRGYGFIEFSHHAHALACLRELNNNPKYNIIASAGGVRTSSSAQDRSGEKKKGGLGGSAAVPGTGPGGRLIVEFSLENVRKVKVLEDRRARQQKFLTEKYQPASEKKKLFQLEHKQQKAEEQKEQNVVILKSEDASAGHSATGAVGGGSVAIAGSKRSSERAYLDETLRSGSVLDSNKRAKTGKEAAGALKAEPLQQSTKKGPAPKKKEVGEKEANEQPRKKQKKANSDVEKQELTVQNKKHSGGMQQSPTGVATDQSALMKSVGGKEGEGAIAGESESDRGKEVGEGVGIGKVGGRGVSGASGAASRKKALKEKIKRRKEKVMVLKMQKAIKRGESVPDFLSSNSNKTINNNNSNNSISKGEHSVKNSKGQGGEGGAEGGVAGEQQGWKKAWGGHKRLRALKRQQGGGSGGKK